MARPDKAAAVEELTASFRESSAAVLTEYRGLTVAELKELRRSLAGNATYSVVKNTLSKIAAREAGLETLVPLLEGPSAIAFVTGDPVEVAKGLKNFTKEHPLLVVKGGVLDGATISADDIKKLADLESREVLLAKLAGGLMAPAQQLANVLAAAEQNAGERKIDQQVFLTARLAPDMFALTKQVQIATDHAKGAPSRLAGREVPKYDDNEASFADLQARIVKTLDHLATFSAADLEGSDERIVYYRSPAVVGPMLEIVPARWRAAREAVTHRLRAWTGGDPLIRYDTYADFIAAANVTFT